MDFYYHNNLLMKDYTCALMTWRIDQEWKLVSVGFPCLDLDIARATLSFRFLNLDGRSVNLKLKDEACFFSHETSSDSILIEIKDTEVDFAIVFKNRNSCVIFMNHLESFRKKSLLIRKFSPIDELAIILFIYSKRENEAFKATAHE
jgi:hypothetical protein